MSTKEKPFKSAHREESLTQLESLQLKKYRKEMLMIPVSVLKLLKEEIHNHRKVIHPNFALVHREITQLQSKIYLANYIKPNLGIRISQFYLKNRLSLGMIKLVMLQLAKFNHYLSSLQLSFSEDLDNNLYIQLNQEQLTLYFANLDFSQPISPQSSHPSKQQEYSLQYFESITSKTSQIAQLRKQDSLLRRLGRFYVKLLVKCEQTKSLYSQSQLLISKMLKNSISLNQVVEQLLHCKLNLDLHYLQIHLSQEKSQQTGCSPIINFKITNRQCVQEIQYRKFDQNLMKKLQLSYRSIEQLFCELTTTHQEQIFITTGMEVGFQSTEQQIIIKFEPKQSSNQEDRRESDLKYQPQSLRGQIGDSVKTCPNTYPYNCIGLVIAIYPNNLVMTGTASLIAPKLIITCAHVVTLKIEPGTKKYRKIEATKLYFTLGGVTYKVSKPKVSEKYFSNLQTRSRMNDYAVLVLQKQIKRKRYFKIAKDYKTQNQFYISGQSSMRMGIANIKGQRQVLKTSDNLIFHYLETEKGDSGSPIFVQLADQSGLFYMIGIHSAQLLQQSKHKKQGIKITQEIAQKILQIEQKYSKNEVISMPFIQKTMIEFQVLNNSINNVSQDNESFLDWVTYLYFDSKKIKNEQLFSTDNIKRSTFKFIVGQIQSIINREKLTQVQFLDQIPRIELHEFQKKAMQIFQSLCLEDGRSILTIFGVFHQLENNLQIYPRLLNAMTNFITCCYQHPKVLSYVMNQQKECLRQIIWQQRQTSQMQFNPDKVYRHILDFWLELFHKLTPQLAAEFIISGIANDIFDKNGNFIMNKTRVECFKSIRWFVLMMCLLDQSQFCKNCLLLINICENHFDKNTVHPFRLQSAQQHAHECQLPIDIQSPFAYFFYYDYGPQDCGRGLKRFQVFNLIGTDYTSKQKFEKFGRKSPILSWIKQTGVRHRSNQLYIICYSETRQSLTIHSYLDQYTRLQQSLFINILYYTVNTLFELHKQGLYLLCPLEFCLVIQTKSKLPRIISKDHYELLQRRLAKVTCPKKFKHYNSYYPIQLIQGSDESPRVCEEADRLILQRSLRKLLLKSKVSMFDTYLSLVDEIANEDGPFKSVDLATIISKIDQLFVVTMTNQR